MAYVMHILQLQLYIPICFLSTMNNIVFNQSKVYLYIARYIGLDGNVMNFLIEKNITELDIAQSRFCCKIFLSFFFYGRPTIFHGQFLIIDVYLITREIC